MDAQAKRDLEQNYVLLLEEKDELNRVLKLQVTLLKEGRDLPPELESKIREGHEREAEQTKSQAAELRTARDKTMKLESLLAKCKETLKSNRERLDALSGERQEAVEALEESARRWEQEKTAAAAQLESSKRALAEFESSSALRLAEFKVMLHSSLEEKDGEIASLRAQLAAAASASGGRDLAELERAWESEKTELVEELSRGKQAAIQLVQEEFKRKLDTLRDEQSAYTASLEEEAAGLRGRLQELQSQAALAVEERDLQKMAALSQSDEQREQLSEALVASRAAASEERERLSASLSAAREEVEQLSAELLAANQRCVEVRTSMKQFKAQI